MGENNKDILNKIKKSKKLIIFLVILAIISLLIISSNIFKADVKSIGQSSGKEILAEFPIEYQLKNINDDGSYEILVTISSNSGINSINYQNVNGQEITLDCDKKLSVGIDYKVEEEQTYYFYVDRVNEGKAIEKIYIERAIPQDGSETYPYIIKTAEQLQNINSKLDAYYKLGANIDLTGRNWQTIGNSVTPFKGELNGNGFTIENLTINSDQDYVGLFGYNQGTLKNLKLDNFNVKGKDNVGALVGYSTGNILGTSVNAVVTGNSNVGGLVRICLCK